MIPIYLKTVYSFLSSTITIDELILFAKQNQLSSLCICDDNMYGVMEFIKKCHNNNIEPIIGVDFDNVLLYAKNYIGYQNLMKLSTIKSEREITIDNLKNNRDGLICFINEHKDNIEEITNVFPEYYIYTEDINNKEYLYLPKILCLKKEDTEILKYLNLLRDGKKISDEYDFNDKCYYIDIYDKRYDEFITKCHLELPKYSLNLPNYCEYNDTLGLDSNEYLYNLSIKGLNKRLNNQVTIRYKDRLLYELDVIKKMGFSNYFLIVYDYIKYAKMNNILVGPGRGSAAGSLVSFSLGITEVDPIKYNLLFERFLNIERITMPDIDTDFPDEKRDEIIDYVTKKYGQDKVCLITTFGTFGSKMALRDMGRVMNVPLYIVDDLCKKIGDKSLKEAIELNNIKGFVESDNKIKKLYEVALMIEGLPRHSSIHAAGVVMANSPLVETIPLVYYDDKYLSAYEAMYLEELGLLKMDFLGIRNLTIIDDTLNLIKEYKKTDIKFNEIPLDDIDTYKIFSNGDTLGIFQFESNGMRDFLMRLKPNSFTDIYNANAFYRPGPSSNIDLYIKRRHNLVQTEYFDESLKDILKDTCGIIVYQEQIMEIAHVMADFTLGEADLLRRAMSKKKKEELIKYQDKFITNAINKGYDKELVSNIYNLILNFASYGFNKSHSVAYSMISYKMAYLKAHYPLYFYLSLLKGALNDDIKTINYIKEMKKHNIKIIKPDINKSTDEFNIYYDNILLPFNIIKGIGSDVAKKIMKARGDGFKDIYDFFLKIIDNGISQNIIELLITSGCLDNFGYNRQTLILNIDSLINYGNLCKELGNDFVLKPEINISNEFEREVLINQEKECFGFYLTNHPVSFYKNKIKSINLIDINKYFNKNITCVVMIDKIKEITTKKGEKMAFLSCSDEEASCDITVFPDLYKELLNLSKSDIIKVDGRVERRSNYNIIANSIINVKEKK